MDKITLANGVRIVFEKIPYVRSVSAGIWIGCGSQDERAGENGMSHFIEHMLFKGTTSRTAVQIAQEMDAVGGQLNAFTTKECTCFYAQTLDTHLDSALEVMADMIFNSLFAEKDVETERGVILEEIGMYEDSPEDLVTERLFDMVYKGTPLGKRILGKPALLKKMTGESLKGYMSRHYVPENVVIALSGNFEDRHIELVRRLFEPMTGKKPRAAKPSFYTPGFTVKRKSTEQNQLCFAFPSIPLGHPDRYAVQLISTALGRGMSSRLFQTVREQLGLCYSIYTFGTMHRDVGVFCVSTALSPETEDKAIRVIMEQLKQFKDEGMTEAELERAREQSKANVLMGMESTAARMNMLGRNELFFAKVPTADEIIAQYDAVTMEQARQVADRLIDFEKMSMSAVGKVKTAEQYKEMTDSWI